MILLSIYAMVDPRTCSCGTVFDADCEGSTNGGECNTCDGCMDETEAYMRIHAYPPRPTTWHEYNVMKGRAREV